MGLLSVWVGGEWCLMGWGGGGGGGGGVCQASVSGYY